MIMRVTMIVMIMRMRMIMIMMSVIMRMIMATATPGAMSMMMGVIMTMVVAMIMCMPMIMAVMIMTVMIMTVVTMRVIMIGAALRLEGARHRRHRAAQTPDHFGEHMIFFDIDRVRCDLGRCMPIADMPSGFQKPHRIIGFNFDECLRCGFDENKRAILQLNRITIIQRRGLFKIE